MAVCVTFGDFSVPGLRMQLELEPPRLQVKRVKHWGVLGVAELQGRAGERQLSVPVWIFNGYSSPGELQAFLNQLDAVVGLYGTLHCPDQGNGVAEQFDTCTFEGFSKKFGPIKDVAGSLDTAGAGKWCCAGALIFTQLIPPS